MHGQVDALRPVRVDSAQWALERDGIGIGGTRERGAAGRAQADVTARQHDGVYRCIHADAALRVRYAYARSITQLLLQLVQPALARHQLVRKLGNTLGLWLRYGGRRCGLIALIQLRLSVLNT